MAVFMGMGIDMAVPGGMGMAMFRRTAFVAGEGVGGEYPVVRSGCPEMAAVVGGVVEPGEVAGMRFVCGM